MLITNHLELSAKWHESWWAHGFFQWQHTCFSSRGNTWALFKKNFTNMYSEKTWIYSICIHNAIKIIYIIKKCHKGWIIWSMVMVFSRNISMSTFSGSSWDIWALAEKTSLLRTEVAGMGRYALFEEVEDHCCALAEWFSTTENGSIREKIHHCRPRKSQDFMVSTSRDTDSYISHNAPAEYLLTDPPYLANNGYLVTQD